MKKLLLQFAFLLLPVFVLAQSNPSISKNFTPKMKGIFQSFKLNDHVSVVQTNVDDENFELIAVNDKMEVLWRTSFKGYAFGADKFKGHILAFAAANHSEKKGYSGPYTGYLVNETTGKLILQKEIYNSSPSDKKELAIAYFTGNGAYCNLAVEQVDKDTRFFPTDKINTSNDLKLMSINEKLEVVNTRHIIPDGTFVNLIYNNNGDLFLFVLQENKTLKVSKYDAGKTEASGAIMQDIDLPNKPEIDYNSRFVFPSPTNPNVVYFTLTHNNPDKDHELTVGKLDFSTHKGQVVNEVFSRNHVRDIEKSYVPFDKKLDKPIIGYDVELLTTRHLEEYNGTLLVTLSEWGSDKLSAGSFSFGELSVIINGYDLNLKPKFQQVLPTHYGFYFPFFTGYHTDNNALYVVSNTASGSSLIALYGKLDLTTGNWVKLEKLQKDDLGKFDYSDYHVMWFTKEFIVPYVDLKNFVKVTQVINLASYQY
jgi:hypothetical protein